MTAATPAQASATGCNNDVWLGIRGTGTYVEPITVSKCFGTTYFYGHNHIFGGGIDANGPAKIRRTPHGISSRGGASVG